MGGGGAEKINITFFKNKTDLHITRLSDTTLLNTHNISLCGVHKMPLVDESFNGGNDEGGWGGGGGGGRER